MAITQDRMIALIHEARLAEESGKTVREFIEANLRFVREHRQTAQEALSSIESFLLAQPQPTLLATHLEARHYQLRERDNIRRREKRGTGGKTAPISLLRPIAKSETAIATDEYAEWDAGASHKPIAISQTPEKETK